MLFDITYWDKDGVLHDVTEEHKSREAVGESLKDRGITQYFISEHEVAQ